MERLTHRPRNHEFKYEIELYNRTEHFVLCVGTQNIQCIVYARLNTVDGAFYLLKHPPWIYTQTSKDISAEQTRKVNRSSVYIICYNRYLHVWNTFGDFSLRPRWWRLNRTRLNGNKMFLGQSVLCIYTYISRDTRIIIVYRTIAQFGTGSANG